MCHSQAGQLLVTTEESSPTVGAHLEILSADHERGGAAQTNKQDVWAGGIRSG